MQQPVPEVPISQPVPEVPSKSSKSKIILLILVALIIVGIVGVNRYYLGTGNQEEKAVLTSSPTPKLIGGDKDEHGCLIGAGYSWCVEKNKCLRTWEESCSATTSASPATDETANWKIFSPPDGAYSFKYPSDNSWKLNEFTGSTSPSVGCQLDCPNAYNIKDFGGGLSDIKSIEEYIKNFNTTNPSGSSKASPYIQEYKKIKINGLDAVETLTQVGELAGSGPAVTVFIVYKGQGYSFGYTYIDLNLNTATKFSQLPLPNPDFVSTLMFKN